MEIREAQKLAWANKLEKGFNTTDVPLEFGLLTAEVGEAFTAWRKRLPDFGEELADVVLYVAALAEMDRVDLAAEGRAEDQQESGARIRARQPGRPHPGARSGRVTHRSRRWRRSIRTPESFPQAHAKERRGRLLQIPALVRRRDESGGRGRASGAGCPCSQAPHGLASNYCP
ncbi:hypothetical protein [Streptomyces sp. NBC_01294]|uniref:hypothetical protein n=1 Tax=Streptomyces sp. NBC_01294 TaxID=2903815 RepID=UPI002DDC37C7|nr:hypothetical protein [Streptomyces sp. NBC_01294]WRZ61557.1 hypothetical protein OG534_36880 [Streptomyces sp. NBC_01294]